MYPHTEPFGNGLMALRIKGSESIARVFFFTLTNQRIVMLHTFIKKTSKTPLKERRIAEKRMKEAQQHADA